MRPEIVSNRVYFTQIRPLATAYKQTRKGRQLVESSSTSDRPYVDDRPVIIPRDCRLYRQNDNASPVTCLINCAQPLDCCVLHVGTPSHERRTEMAQALTRFDLETQSWRHIGSQPAHVTHSTFLAQQSKRPPTVWQAKYLLQRFDNQTMQSNTQQTGGHVLSVICPRR